MHDGRRELLNLPSRKIHQLRNSARDEIVEPCERLSACNLSSLHSLVELRGKPSMLRRVKFRSTGLAKRSSVRLVDALPSSRHADSGRPDHLTDVCYLAPRAGRDGTLRLGLPKTFIPSLVGDNLWPEGLSFCIACSFQSERPLRK
jgi:hypothetical protein